ncbi:MAG: hypothetical protein ACREEC_03810, partial [Thermoplasmata archaeon]
MSLTTVRATEAISLGDLSFDLAPPELRRRGERTIQEVERRVGELGSSAGAPSIASFVEPLNELLVRVTDVAAHGSLVFAVHPDPATRAAAREMSEAADRFFNAYRLNDTIYGRLGAVDATREDPTTRFALEKMLRDMRRAGVEKDPPTR